MIFWWQWIGTPSPYSTFLQLSSTVKHNLSLPCICDTAWIGTPSYNSVNLFFFFPGKTPAAPTGSNSLFLLCAPCTLCCSPSTWRPVEGWQDMPAPGLGLLWSCIIPLPSCSQRYHFMCRMRSGFGLAASCWETLPRAALANICLAISSLAA